MAALRRLTLATYSENLRTFNDMRPASARLDPEDLAFLLDHHQARAKAAELQRQNLALGVIAHDRRVLGMHPAALDHDLQRERPMRGAGRMLDAPDRNPGEAPIHGLVA